MGINWAGKDKRHSTFNYLQPTQDRHLTNNLDCQDDSMYFKVPLTPKIFFSRQKGPFCSVHIGEKIIVVRFFLDFL